MSSALLTKSRMKVSNRVINITPSLLQVLREHKTDQNKVKLQAGGAYDERKLNLVFANEIGDPLCPRAFSRNFERLVESAGLNITFHGLRHTFATIALEEGVNVKTIQETLGHHSSAFTMDIYSNVTAKMKTDKVSKRLSSLVR